MTDPLAARRCAYGAHRVVPNFRQGFNGRGCERYPSGAVYVGEYAVRSE